jgi:hypothetical protein
MEDRDIADEISRLLNGSDELGFSDLVRQIMKRFPGVTAWQMRRALGLLSDDDLLRRAQVTQFPS